MDQAWLSLLSLSIVLLQSASVLSAVQAPMDYVNTQTEGWLLVFWKSPAEAEWWTEDIWFLPPTCLQTHKHTHCRGSLFWFPDFPRRKGLPARGFKQSFLLLRHFTGTCRCLLEVALRCVCFDTGSLVFTHCSDRLGTDRDIRSNQNSSGILFLSCTSCAPILLSENPSCSSVFIKRFSFSHLSRQINPHSSARIIIQGESQPSSCVLPGSLCSVQRHIHR